MVAERAHRHHHMSQRRADLNRNHLMYNRRLVVPALLAAK